MLYPVELRGRDPGENRALLLWGQLSGQVLYHGLAVPRRSRLGWKVGIEPDPARKHNNIQRSRAGAASESELEVLESSKFPHGGAWCLMEYRDEFPKQYNC